MDIISKKLANGFFYAYHAGRFWRWDEGRKLWKESHLLAKKYDLNHEYDKLLTPEDFLADPALFARQNDVIQLPDCMLEALRAAVPCQNAPIEPVTQQETAVSAPAVTQENKPSVPDDATAFDYTGLDAQTVDALHMAENQYTQGKKMAETGLRWMVNAVAMAHDALCGAVVPQWDNSKHGNRGDDTFRAWCASLDISKSSAYRLLSVSEKFGNIQLEGKSILDVQPATLLYEAAKPSAPAEMVQKVTTGEITSSAEYRAILKENQQLRTDRVNALNRADAAENRANAAEAREEEAWSMVSKAQGEAQTAKADLEAAQKARADAENEASAAKGQLDAATADVNGLYEENSRLNAEKEQAIQRAAKAEEALRHQPITAVVDKEEVQRQAKKLFADMADEEIDRRAHQQAYGIAADLNAGTVAEKEQLQKELDGLRKNNTQLERRMKDMTSQLGDLSQTDFETANYCPAAMLSIWNSCKGSYSRLTGDDLESTFLCICNAVNAIKKEASLLCRQPEGYKGGNEV